MQDLFLYPCELVFVYCKRDRDSVCVSRVLESNPGMIMKLMLPLFKQRLNSFKIKLCIIAQSTALLLQDPGHRQGYRRQRQSHFRR